MSVHPLPQARPAKAFGPRAVIEAVRRVAPDIEGRAAVADRGETDLQPDCEALQAAGLARAALPSSDGGIGLCYEPDGLMPGVETLRLLGRANLSVARLFEGHVNAVKLVALYGDEPARAEVAEAVNAGGLLGVWGADAQPPVTLHGETLSGRKRFCSGLGLLSHALVTATTEDDALQLVLVPADDPVRQIPGTWRTSGMRATVSGDYDLEGIPAPRQRFVGAPGDFLREPHFKGGVWRYAAAQLGGLEALAEAMRQDLARRGRLEAPHQAARLGRALIACETGRHWVEGAGLRSEAPGAGAEAVAYASLARLAVEKAAVETMEEADRALGAASFLEGHPVERIRRDLGFFLRQADPDGFLHDAATTAASDPRAVGDLFGPPEFDPPGGA